MTTLGCSCKSMCCGLGMSDMDGTLIDIDKRLVVLEERSRQNINTRRWIMGLAGFAVIQLGTLIFSYGQITQQIDDINLDELQANMVTALTVLGDHGTEIETVRGEQARVRGNIDQLHTYMENLRQKVDNQTRERFFKHDGDRLEERILRLENRVFGGAE